MDKWPGPKSNTRIALGLTFIIAGLVWAVYFFEFIHFSPLDRLTGWVGAITAGVFLFSGFCIGFGVKPKSAIAGFLVFVTWSLGLALLPVAGGYSEAVFGGWFLVLFAIVALYERYKKKNAAYENISKK